MFYNINLPISDLPKNKIWFAQIRVRAATPILHLVDALSFLYCISLKKKGCCVCGKGEGRRKGVKGACVGGCSPSLWSSPAAVGCSLPCFYKKLLFRVDLLDFFVDMILLCVVFHWGWQVLQFRARAGGGYIFSIFFFLVFQSPISNQSKKKTKYHLGKIGCGRQPPPDDYRVLPLDPV